MSWLGSNYGAVSVDLLVPAVPITTSTATFALSAGYVHNTSGRAVVLATFVAPETANLTAFWFNISSYTGTWGSTDGNINYEIREGWTATSRPSTTLTASGTITLDGSTTGYIKVTGLSIGLTAGKQYTLILYDSDGGGTNYVTITNRINSSTGTISTGATPLYAHTLTTTDGFATAATTVAGYGPVGLVIGGLTLGGNIWSTIAVSTSGTYERGVRFCPTENCRVVGIQQQADTTMLFGGHTFKLYADAANPGDTPLLSYSPPSTTGGIAHQNLIEIMPVANHYNLTGGTWYRFVIDPASSINVPRKVTTACTDADLVAACMPFAGSYYWTEESGGAFVDDTDALCALTPLFAPNTDAAGGGGSLIGGRLVRV